jgi:hypothetical protein
MVLKYSMILFFVFDHSLLISINLHQVLAKSCVGCTNKCSAPAMYSDRYNACRDNEGEYAQQDQSLPSATVSGQQRAQAQGQGPA